MANSKELKVLEECAKNIHESRRLLNNLPTQSALLDTINELLIRSETKIVKKTYSLKNDALKQNGETKDGE